MGAAVAEPVAPAPGETVDLGGQLTEAAMAGISPDLLLDMLASQGGERVREGLAGAPAGMAPSAGQLQAKGKHEFSIEYEQKPLITLYDEIGFPSHVPKENLMICLRSGLRFRCPLCSGQHDTSDWNACPKRDRVPFTECPYCLRTWGIAKRIYATTRDLDQAEAGKDPNFMSVMEEDFLDPKAQLREKFNMHMLAKHPQEALARGIRGGEA